MKGSDGKVRREVHMVIIMNEGNDWNHNVEEDAIEISVD